MTAVVNLSRHLPFTIHRTSKHNVDTTGLEIRQTMSTDVGFEGLIAMSMKSSVFCDMTLCSLVKFNEHQELCLLGHIAL
jgi:hypothetical protein